MCHFFSLVSNGDGKPLYFDARIRREIISGKSKSGQLTKKGVKNEPHRQRLSFV